MFRLLGLFVVLYLVAGIEWRSGSAMLRKPAWRLFRRRSRACRFNTLRFLKHKCSSQLERARSIELRSDQETPSEYAHSSNVKRVARERPQPAGGREEPLFMRNRFVRNVVGQFITFSFFLALIL